MILSTPFLDRIVRFLQIFDTSLGICVDAEEITLVRLRRELRGFRVLKTASLPCPPQAELSQRIREAIARERMDATYTIVGIPQAAVLLKQCSVPLMPDGEIDAYLAAHPALFLPPGLESEQLRYHFHRLEIDDAQLHLQLLIYRTSQADAYARMFAGLPVYRLFAGSTGLLNLVTLGGKNFSGMVLHAGTSNLTALRFRAGRLILFAEMRGSFVDAGGASGYATHFRRWWLERFPSGISHEKCVLYGVSPELSVIAAELKNAGIDLVERNAEPGVERFTQAYSLSLTPFGDPAAAFALHLPQNAGDRNTVFFRQLTLKSALFLGTVILFAATGFGLMNMVMAGQLQQEVQRQEALTPLLTLRDSLAFRLDSLSQARNRLTRLAGSRSRHAFYLYQITAMLPKGVWFQVIHMDVPSSGALTVQLVGQARDAAQLTRFLRMLEMQSFIREMRLEEMAVRPEGQVAGRCEFRVQVNVAN